MKALESQNNAYKVSFLIFNILLNVLNNTSNYILSNNIKLDSKIS